MLTVIVTIKRVYICSVSSVGENNDSNWEVYKEC